MVAKGINCNARKGKHCPKDIPKGKPCGGWAIEFRNSDGKWTSLIFPENKTRHEAEEYLNTIQTDIRRGVFNLPKKQVIPNLAEYSKRYLEFCKNDKENTYLMKRRALGVLVKYLGNYSLNEITPFIIQKYRLERKEKDVVKDSVINIDVGILSHLFTTAIEDGIVEKNPCKEVKRLKIMQKKERVLSKDEISLLIEKLHSKDRLMLLIGLFTGMRLNEVISLRWFDFDFDRGILTFTQSKTGKLLTIPLSDYLIKELMEWKSYRSGNTLFEDRKITKSIIQIYSGRFSNLFKKLGIHNCTYHTLRHTFSSLLQSDLGIGAVVVQGMTGHSSLSMLQRYSHTGMDSKKQAINKLTGYITNSSKNDSLPVAV